MLVSYIFFTILGVLYATTATTVVAGIIGLALTVICLVGAHWEYNQLEKRLDLLENPPKKEEEETPNT